MVSAELAVDLFSGPDGWGEGLRQAGADVEVVNFEIDPTANATAKPPTPKAVRIGVIETL